MDNNIQILQYVIDYIEKHISERIMDYIYKEWFPKSNSQLNEQARVDFIRYGEQTDEKGESRIEVWVPVIF